MNDNVKKALSELERECPGYAWSLNVLRVRITELETERRALLAGLVDINVATTVPGTSGDMADLGWCPSEQRNTLQARLTLLEKDRDDWRNTASEALSDGRTVVEATDQMRQEWAEIEEQLIGERDEARTHVLSLERQVHDLRKLHEKAETERARVVAYLRKQNQLVYPSARFLANRYERGEHEREGT